jgi:hypothetical protein
MTVHSARVRRPEETPDRPHRDDATPGGRVAEILSLQRTAGNQAVARMLQRSVEIGPPGNANAAQRQTYSTAPDVALLTGALAARLGAVPGWVAAEVANDLPALVTGAAAYEFATPGDVVDWIVLRAVATRLHGFAAAPMPANAQHAAQITPTGEDLKEAYVAIEALRAAYQQAGNAAQHAPSGKAPFNLFTLNYEVDYSGPNHHYAYRNGESVVYSEQFKRSNAQSILNHLRYNGRNARFGGRVEMVDNFVCSFLAEPTRWPVEQIFNLLATQNTDGEDSAMAGGTVAGTLPMAAGGTYNAVRQVVGHDMPNRALAHARSEGLWDKIDAKLAGSNGLQHLVSRVAKELGLVV